MDESITPVVYQADSMTLFCSDGREIPFSRETIEWMNGHRSSLGAEPIPVIESSNPHPRKD